LQSFLAPNLSFATFPTHVFEDCTLLCLAVLSLIFVAQNLSVYFADICSYVKQTETGFIVFADISYTFSGLLIGNSVGKLIKTVLEFL